MSTSTFYAHQSDLWVSASGGSDANNGLTVGTPLATLEELFCRLNAPNTLRLKQSMTIHCGSGDYALSAARSLNVIIPTGVTLSVVATATTTRTSSMTSVTAISRTGTPQALQFNDGSFDFSTAIGQQLLINSGPRSGAIAWIARGVSAGVARISPTSTLNPFTAPTVVTPAGTDAYILRTLPRVPVGAFRVLTDSADPDFLSGYIFFSGIHLAGGTTGGAGLGGVFELPRDNAAWFDACWLDNVRFVGGNAYTTRCRSTACHVQRSGKVDVHAGLIDSAWQLGSDGSRLTIDEDTLAQGTGLVIAAGLSSVVVGNAGAFDGSIPAIDLSGGARAECRQIGPATGQLYGTTASGNGVRVGRGCSLQYVLKPNVNTGLGAGREVSVGTNDLTWAQVPIAEDASGAYVATMPAQTGGGGGSGSPGMGGGGPPPPDPPPTPPPPPDPTPPPNPPPGGGTGGSVARPAFNTGTGFYVVGSRLYDANGVEFRPRGLNDIGFWRGGNNRAQLRASYVAMHANAVRIPLSGTFAADAPGTVDTPAWRQSLAQGFIDNDMVPIPAAFVSRADIEATGNNNPSALVSVVDDWVSTDLAWIQALERYILLNIANEWGPDNSAVWRDTYITQVARIRAAGIRCALVIDAGGSGEDSLDIKNFGAAILAADPQHNIVFSIHCYSAFWREPTDPADGTWGNGQPYNTTTELAAMASTGLCIMVGEFSANEYNTGFFGATLTPATVMAAAEANNMGFLAWQSFNDSTENVLNDSGAGNDPLPYPPAANLSTFGHVLVESANGLLARAAPATIF